MLQPVFHPFDRPARHPGACRNQDDVGEHPLLDAEAAARLRRGAQADPVAGHPQRAGDYGVNGERPLEIRQHIIGVTARVVLGQHTIGFDRRAGAARILDGDADLVGGVGKRSLRVTVAEAPVTRDVAAQAGMQHGGAGLQGGQRLHDDGQSFILHRDQIQRVFGDVAVGRHGDRDGLAHIADAVGRDRPALDRRLDAHHEAAGQGLDVRPGEHGGHARQRRCARCIDCLDDGVAMRRAQDGGVERRRRNGGVVKIPAAPGQQRRVFHPGQRLANPKAGGGLRNWQVHRR